MKYEIGDVLLIDIADNHSTKRYIGVIIIEDIDISDKIWKFYHIKAISGNINFSSILMKSFDSEPKVRRLGNIGIGKGWKVLYGGNGHKQRTY